MAERQKLTVIQVKDVQKVGEKQREKLTLLARGEDGKDLSYFTFRTSLFDAIRNNKEIEVDVDISSHEYEGTTYWDRKVTEIYIDGKPVAQRAGRQWGGKSPEERAEIRQTVAVYVVKDLLIAGKIPEDHPRVMAMNDWLDEQLAGKRDVPMPIKEAVPGAVSDKSQESVIASDGVDMSPVKNKGDLFTRCKKYLDLTKSQALDKMGGIWEVDLEDLDDAWQQVCAVMLTKEKKEEESGQIRH